MSMYFFFWKSSKLNKEFNEPIPWPPSGLETPQKRGYSWGIFNFFNLRQYTNLMLTIEIIRDYLNEIFGIDQLLPIANLL